MMIAMMAVVMLMLMSMLMQVISDGGDGDGDDEAYRSLTSDGCVHTQNAVECIRMREPWRGSNPRCLRLPCDPTELPSNPMHLQ